MTYLGSKVLGTSPHVQVALSPVWLKIPPGQYLSPAPPDVAGTGNRGNAAVIDKHADMQGTEVRKTCCQLPHAIQALNTGL